MLTMKHQNESWLLNIWFKIKTVFSSAEYQPVIVTNIFGSGAYLREQQNDFKAQQQKLVVLIVLIAKIEAIDHQ